MMTGVSIVAVYWSLTMLISDSDAGDLLRRDAVQMQGALIMQTMIYGLVMGGFNDGTVGIE